ncbi:exonuclease [Microbacterium phage Lifes]|nr:exonuclease [Microbacterium phage Lifes]
MTQPKLAVAGSGYGGRGYKQIFGDGTIVPSVTTALGAVGDPRGLIHWNVEQTALYAVTHIDDLLNRTEEAGVRYLQYVTKRQKDEVLDDLDLNVFTASRVVLDDKSNTGTYIHQYIDDDLNDRFTTDPLRPDHIEMVEAWHVWKSEHDIEVLATEATVFGDGYAGTGDFWAIINGVPTLVDAKSSRKVRFSHIAQLAALGACDTMAVEVSKGTEGAVYHKLTPAVAAQHNGQVDSYWEARATPAFTQYAVLQIRPGDYHSTTGEYIEPFCELHVIPQAKIEAGWKFFQAGLMARHAERELREAEKGD